MNILGYMVAYENGRLYDKECAHLSHLNGCGDIFRFRSDAEIVLAGKQLESPGMKYSVVEVSIEPPAEDEYV